MFTPLGLDHVVLRVRDQAASQRFYTDALGCTLDHVNEVVRLVQLRFGDQLIDLLPGDPAAAGPAAAIGMDHFCLSIRCDDLGHHLLDLLEVLGGDAGAFRETDVVKEAVLGRRPVDELRLGPELLDGLRHHVGRGMPQ